jgi:hypothetical protein
MKARRDRGETDLLIIGEDCDEKVVKDMKHSLKCFYTTRDSFNNKWTELQAILTLSRPNMTGITEIDP